jgi:hypothetical protein
MSNGMTVATVAMVLAGNDMSVPRFLHRERAFTCQTAAPYPISSSAARPGRPILVEQVRQDLRTRHAAPSSPRSMKGRAGRQAV